MVLLHRPSDIVNVAVRGSTKEWLSSLKLIAVALLVIGSEVEVHYDIVLGTRTS